MYTLLRVAPLAPKGLSWGSLAAICLVLMDCFKGSVAALFCFLGVSTSTKTTHLTWQFLTFFSAFFFTDGHVGMFVVSNKITLTHQNGSFHFWKNLSWRIYIPLDLCVNVTLRDRSPVRCSNFIAFTSVSRSMKSTTLIWCDGSSCRWSKMKHFPSI